MLTYTLVVLAALAFANAEPECKEHMRTGMCPKIMMPVCASDGKTYNNDCLFCYHKYQLQDVGADLRFVHQGRCEPKDHILRGCEPGMRKGCPKNYFPICASDGNTYNNLCMMCRHKFELMDQTNGNVDLHVVHDGRCESQPADLLRACSPAMRHGCPKNYRPICASDGNTYNNLCMMCARKYEIMDQTNGNVDLHVVHDGRC